MTLSDSFYRDLLCQIIKEYGPIPCVYIGIDKKRYKLSLYEISINRRGLPSLKMPKGGAKRIRIIDNIVWEPVYRQAEKYARKNGCLVMGPNAVGEISEFGAKHVFLTYVEILDKKGVLPKSHE